MRKSIIGAIFLFNYLFSILDFNYSSFFIKTRFHNYLLRANKRLSKRGEYLLNLSNYFSVVPDTQPETLQYLKPKKYYLFYVTLVSLFLTIGVLDIFLFSNSAFSLMVYLLSIILVLLLILYGAPLVMGAVDELESHLISFSSIKNKSLSTTITLLKVSLGLKINSNLSFFNIWKIFFVRSTLHNFVFWWYGFNKFILGEIEYACELALCCEDRLYKF